MSDENTILEGHSGDLRSVSIVIISFQSAEIIKGALNSIDSGREIICVDNASTDNIADVIYGRQVTFIKNEINVGYARACNQGAAAATGDFILFMNPDVILERGAINALLTAANRYPDADVFVPRTAKEDGARWYHDASSFDRQRKPAVVKLRGEVVGDCCMRFVDGGIFLVRRTTFQALGGFDENIFLYFEDDDFSLRLLAAGHTVIHVHDARVVHTVGTSSHPIIKYVFTKNFYKKRSEIYMHKKYGLNYSYQIDICITVAKIIFYFLSLRPRRTLAACGRLWGINSMRGRSNHTMS